MPTTKSRTKQAKQKSHRAKKAVSKSADTSTNYRVRVRMYRPQGLGDCFLLTFPRKEKAPFNLLIDCGALQQNKKEMIRLVEHIESSVKTDGQAKGRLDLVVATHEHKDHLSGFNQARDVFNRLEIGGVWLGWTENLTLTEANEIKKSKRLAVKKLQEALASPFGETTALNGVSSLLDFSFSESDDTTGAGRIAEALEYLKLRGKDARNLHYLEPGDGPLTLDGVEEVRVFVLGPPRDPNEAKAQVYEVVPG